jgi:hypothetical protein
MSTPKITDNELDALFKQATEEREIPFDASAWAKMQKKLRMAIYWRWAKWSLGSLLGLGLITVFILSLEPVNVNKNLQNRPQTTDHRPRIGELNNDVKENSQNADNQVINSPPTIDDRPQTNNNKLNSDLNKNSQNADNQVINSPPTIDDRPQTNNNKLNSDLNKNSQNTDNQVINGWQTNKEKLNSGLNKNSQNTDNQIVIDRPHTIDDRGQTNKEKLNSDLNKNSQNTDNQVLNRRQTTDDIPQTNTDNRLQTIDDRGQTNKEKLNSDLNKNSQNADNQIVRIKTLDIRPSQMPETPALPDSLQTTQSSQPNRFGRWALQLSLAPDWSTVGTAKRFKLGEHIGLSLEYQLLRRLSFTAGISYSNKVYVANPDEYMPYPGIWQRVPKPDEIDAGCQVLEVPINVRYYAFASSRSRWFVSTGISSYWMLRERYQYNYNYTAYPRPNGVKEVNNENRHLFSIVNLSLGWEKSLSPYLRFQIEPYLKLPLGEVGYGKVRLVTAGVFLNLKYQFLK